MSSTSPKFRLVEVDDLDSEQGETVEDDLIGITIAGRYTIQAHLGGGGMADVYRAHDDELGIDVAIKLLRPEIATGEMRARMIQEARAAAQVRHGNLVRVFGTGKTTHSAYIAMELLDGPNLEMHLRERPGERLPWNEAIELLLPALEALHAVHERGYVHRDIKPGNILVAREPGCPPRAVVIDLGLAKPDRALRDAAGPPTTEAGRVLCTPGYASPEQAAQLPLDRRSDVYSMAITLYRVLAGRPPFHNARGKPIYVWFHHHVNVDPTRLVDAAGDVDIPPAIVTVIESALAKDPADRPQTMLAFAEALQTAATASTPASRSPFHHWPLGIVLAQAVILLFSWWLVQTSGEGSRMGKTRTAIHHAVATKTTAEPPAAVAPTTQLDPSVADSPAPPEQPTPVIPPAADVPDPPVTQRPDPIAITRRVLARRAPAVQACVDGEIGSIERLAASVNIDAAGRVSAHIDGAAETPLSRCLTQALQHSMASPPPRPLSFIHTFKLQATPRQP
ncbi:MAG: serine/threonine protein kinase [Myxococcales bacterium]|nr:serine/threonine protein kinase [Myxococcales bacterium]